MGFANWMARKGNVGGVARNIAEGWKKIQVQNPGLSAKEIAFNYASIRFGLINQIEVESIRQDIDSGKVKTPLDLAWALLMAENKDEWVTLLEKRPDWLKIMREELLKKGLDPDLEF